MQDDISDAQYPQNALSAEEQEAYEYVRDVKGFYAHLAIFVMANFGLLIFNLIITPDHFWFFYALFGWSVGLASHGVMVFEWFDFFDAKWEQRQIEKRLKDKRAQRSR